MAPTPPGSGDSSSSSPPPPPSSSDQQHQQTAAEPAPSKPDPFMHNAAIAVAILCPIGLLLPTRGSKAKSTLQNALLGGAAFWGFDTLAADYTGKSITTRSKERWRSLLGMSSSSSDGKQGKGEKEEKEYKPGWTSGLPTARAAKNKELMEAERRRRAEAEGREYKSKKKQSAENRKGWWTRVWMGGEEPGWQEKRLEEERKALESGKGYGELIINQVKEVWEGKGGKGGEGKE